MGLGYLALRVRFWTLLASKPYWWIDNQWRSIFARTSPLALVSFAVLESDPGSFQNSISEARNNRIQILWKLLSSAGLIRSLNRNWTSFEVCFLRNNWCKLSFSKTSCTKYNWMLRVWISHLSDATGDLSETICSQLPAWKWYIIN